MNRILSFSRTRYESFYFLWFDVHPSVSHAHPKMNIRCVSFVSHMPIAWVSKLISLTVVAMVILTLILWMRTNVSHVWISIHVDFLVKKQQLGPMCDWFSRIFKWGEFLFLFCVVLMELFKIIVLFYIRCWSKVSRKTRGFGPTMIPPNY